MPESHTFHACPDCHGTVRDDLIEGHIEWHDELDAKIERASTGTLELSQDWPGDPVPAEPAGPYSRL